jgi:hypothetical protein
MEKKEIGGSRIRRGGEKGGRRKVRSWRRSWRRRWGSRIRKEGEEGGRRRVRSWGRTANEGPMRIQYKCLVPIYVIPEMKLHCLIISKTEF